MSARLLTTAALLAAAVAADAGNLYKWVDEQGNVQYSDSIPPEAVKKSHSELSKSGMEVNKYDKVNTTVSPATQVEQAIEADRQVAYDKMLMDMYLQEDDIIRARDNRITLIEGSIELTTKTIESITKTIDRLNQELRESKPDTPVMKKAQQQLTEATEQKTEYEKYIENKRREQEEIRTKFNSDLARFRELKTKK